MFMGFPRQEYWSGLPFPSLRDLPNPRIELASPAWKADSLPLSPLGSPCNKDTSSHSGRGQEWVREQVPEEGTLNGSFNWPSKKTQMRGAVGRAERQEWVVNFTCYLGRYQLLQHLKNEILLAIHHVMSSMTDTRRLLKWSTHSRGSPPGSGVILKSLSRSTREVFRLEKSGHVHERIISCIS